MKKRVKAGVSTAVGMSGEKGCSDGPIRALLQSHDQCLALWLSSNPWPSLKMTTARHLELASAYSASLTGMEPSSQSPVTISGTDVLVTHTLL